MSDFIGFPKIKRLFRDIIVTEKIDGTNAQVTIVPVTGPFSNYDKDEITVDLGEYVVFAGSRKRYVVPGNDNFGFAKWVKEHAEKLVEILGEGTHYGEWWGQGIQRKYGLDHKCFSLFNTDRWGFLNAPERRVAHDIPKSLRAVPVLYNGPFSQTTIEDCLRLIGSIGSVAAPGFMNPEGIVIFHTHSNTLHKVTLEGDQPKGDGRG